MIKQLMMKWFGITEPPCRSCEILQMELNRVITEKNDLLARILNPPVPIIEKESKEEFRPITPQHVPWRVRQQMMEAEDAKRAQLLKQSAKEIADLEKELGLPSAEEVDRGPIVAKVK